jgi:predicted 3-demethylubiquinone-9 3-methyltransferase (glyoxalase superfamily)
MAQINPHINFNGNAEEAFNFYKSVFGYDTCAKKFNPKIIQNKGLSLIYILLIQEV